MQFDPNAQSAVTVILMVLYFVIVMGIVIYIQGKMTLKNRRCKALEDKIYPSVDSFITDLPESKAKLPLRDYYIKSAYNCCAVGLYKNSYVSLCALNACLGQGNRFLDFEIYSIDKKPVVAVSSLPDFNIKESYNSISLNKVLAHIAENAFSSGSCPNSGDPLFLNFRIKSKHPEIYDATAALIYKHLESRTLGNYKKKFGYANSGSPTGVPKNLFGPEDGPHGQNDGISFKNAKNRVIIIVEKTMAGLLENSKLYEYVNAISGEGFIHTFRYTQGIKNTHDPDSLIHSSKRGGMIVLPDLKASDANYNFFLAKSYGCQFMCMAVQEFDENLEAYDIFFGEAGSAFVKKPDNLILQIDILEETTPANIKHNYNKSGTRSMGGGTALVSGLAPADEDDLASGNITYRK